MTFKIFFPGEKVYLINDKKKEVYEIIKRTNDISRGPMRQYPPDFSYFCRRKLNKYEDYYDYLYFRSSSLKRKHPLWKYWLIKLFNL